MTNKKRIVVVGSINMDLVARTPRIPAPGETILGDQFVTIPGGKGANQAVAAAKLVDPAIEVVMVGRVGGDDFGTRLLNGLTQHKVNTDYVTLTEGASSGVAMILVDKKGENSIVVAPGTNAKLSQADIDAAENVIATAAAVVMQLEVPLETISYTLAMCQRHGVFTILDPAPVPPKGLPRPIYGVDVLTPNQSEALRLLNIDPQSSAARRPSDLKQIGTRLLSRGSKAVALKLGAKGAMLVGADGNIKTIRPFKVKVHDTTAAGDAFTGALAVAKAEGMDMATAMRFAAAAGAACCASFGAQPALPERTAVEALLNP